MTEHELLEALSIGEGTDWEFKSARGGLPASMWETYSAMANTDGGMIGLGVDERADGLLVSGLPDVAKTQKSFWDTINNRGKVSVNLLSDADVSVIDVAGDDVLVISVPRAGRSERPVYVGQNPLDGTYRRYYEGDYKCRREEVGRMLADQSEESQDLMVLPHFSITDLDTKSVGQFRNRFSARSPDHPWLKLDQAGFLEKLKAIRTDRVSGATGLTVAGLLMFGLDDAIRDADGVPEFNVDFRERLSDDPAVRWTDRLHYDGTWVCNIFQFYERVVPRLTADLKIPFRLENLARKDDTIVHEAIREAFVNSLIHADHRGQGGVIVEKYRDRLEFSNPGTLLLSQEQLLKGGVSECRNRTLQTMFSLLGYGEKAGSGVDKIRQGWASQHWRFPKIQETSRPDRVQVIMPMVSLLPEDSVQRLRDRFGAAIDALSPVEIQALVTADTEQKVDNPRLREMCDEHSADLSRLLQGLVAKGLLTQKGQRRWSFYELAEGNSPHNGGNAPITTNGNSPHNGDGTPSITGANSEHSDDGTPNITRPNSEHSDPTIDPKLVEIARPSREKGRLSPAVVQELILSLCSERSLSLQELATLLGRHPVGIRTRFLVQMVDEGKLKLLYPDELNHPNQAYTAKDASE